MRRIIKYISLVLLIGSFSFTPIYELQAQSVLERFSKRFLKKNRVKKYAEPHENKKHFVNIFKRFPDLPSARPENKGLNKGRVERLNHIGMALRQL